MQTLRKRPTYNEVVNYLENEQPKIKYPDRRATFLRNSPYLSQFDGDSWIDLEEQENKINKEKLKEMEVKRIATQEGSTAQVLRARQAQRYSIASNASVVSDVSNDYTAEFLSDIEDEQQQQQEMRASILDRGRQMINRMLGQTEQQVVRPEFLPQQEATQASLPPLEDIPTKKQQDIINKLSDTARITKEQSKHIVDALIEGQVGKRGKSEAIVKSIIDSVLDDVPKKAKTEAMVKSIIDSVLDDVQKDVSSQPINTQTTMASISDMYPLDNETSIEYWKKKKDKEYLRRQIYLRGSYPLIQTGSTHDELVSVIKRLIDSGRWETTISDIGEKAYRKHILNYERYGKGEKVKKDK